MRIFLLDGSEHPVHIACPASAKTCFAATSHSFNKADIGNSYEKLPELVMSFDSKVGMGTEP